MFIYKQHLKSFFVFACFLYVNSTSNLLSPYGTDRAELISSSNGRIFVRLKSEHGSLHKDIILFPEQKICKTDDVQNSKRNSVHMLGEISDKHVIDELMAKRDTIFST